MQNTNGDPERGPPLYEKAAPVADQSPACDRLTFILHTVRAMIQKPVTPMTRLAVIDEYLREQGF